jgi:hypothetical protein
MDKAQLNKLIAGLIVFSITVVISIFGYRKAESKFKKTAFIFTIVAATFLVITLPMSTVSWMLIFGAIGWLMFFMSSFYFLKAAETLLEKINYYMLMLVMIILIVFSLYGLFIVPAWL